MNKLFIVIKTFYSVLYHSLPIYHSLLNYPSLLTTSCCSYKTQRTLSDLLMFLCVSAHQHFTQHQVEPAEPPTEPLERWDSYENFNLLQAESASEGRKSLCFVLMLYILVDSGCIEIIYNTMQ